MKRKHVWEVRIGLSVLGLLLIIMVVLAAKRWYQVMDNHDGTFKTIVARPGIEKSVAGDHVTNNSKPNEDKLLSAMATANDTPTLLSPDVPSAKDSATPVNNIQQATATTYTTSPDLPAGTAQYAPSTLAPSVDAQPINAQTAKPQAAKVHDASPQTGVFVPSIDIPFQQGSGTSNTSPPMNPLRNGTGDQTSNQGSSVTIITVSGQSIDSTTPPPIASLSSSSTDSMAPPFIPSGSTSSVIIGTSTSGSLAPAWSGSSNLPHRRHRVELYTDTANAVAAAGSNDAGSNASPPTTYAPAGYGNAPSNLPQTAPSGTANQTAPPSAYATSPYSAPSSYGTAPSYGTYPAGNAPIAGATASPNTPAATASTTVATPASYPMTSSGGYTPPSTYDNGTNAAGVAPLHNDRGRRDDGTYEVQPNDNYWLIAQKIYNNGAFYKALAEVNKLKSAQPDRLAPGQIISTPPVAELRKNYPDLCPRPGRREAVHNHSGEVSQTALAAGARVYVVQEGDTLSSIAHYELGKISRWAEIYELNRDAIGKEYNYLTPGMQLVMPPKDTTKSDRVTRQPDDSGPYRR